MEVIPEATHGDGVSSSDADADSCAGSKASCISGHQDADDAEEGGEILVMPDFSHGDGDEVIPEATHGDGANVDHSNNLWATHTNLLAPRRQKSRQLIAEKEVEQVTRLWIPEFVQHCSWKAAAVRRLGWDKVLAHDVARVYVWRLTAGLEAYLCAAADQQAAFEQELEDLEEVWMREQLSVCVELNTMSGEKISYIMDRESKIKDLVLEATAMKQTSASSTDPGVVAYILYPGTKLEVPRSIRLDAFWKGEVDSWFLSTGVDLNKVRDRAGVLHFDVVMGVEEGERRWNRWEKRGRGGKWVLE